MKKIFFSARFCRACLQSSLSVPDMILVAKLAYPNYDIYKKGGYPNGYPIANQDAANQIANDMLRDGYYIDFVELLVKLDSRGYMGRFFDFRGLDDVVRDIIQAGFTFDNATGQFFENQRERISRNWGRLLEGDERKMAVLRLDIAGNSVLVKENPKELVEKAYGDVRTIVTKAINSRMGRLWSWEGDGALGVFMLNNYSRMAICAGMEILNELFLYNKINNPLKSEIKIRLAAHSGNIVYSNSESECLKAETVKRAVALEVKAQPNTLVISGPLAVTQDQSLLNIFSNEKTGTSEKYLSYQVNQERL
jgi:class 3 adenylate cyclase